MRRKMQMTIKKGGGVGGRGEEKEGKRQKKVDGIEEDR